METRWMKHKNENGEIEKFYPITHAKAIVYGDDDEDILTSMEAHLTDKNNPHGLDAEDVGALPVDGTAASATTLTGLTATVAELNYVDGVTSNIQTQLNGKAASSHGNHVPDTETANNAKFLRNDNTWQTVTPANIGAAASSHNHGAGEITSGTLGVARGGTGATTFTSGAALIGAGTGAVTTRAITNNTSSAAVTANTNLVTANTLHYHTAARLNRTDSVTAANTSYGTYMARAIAAGTSTPTSLTNGVIYLQY